MLPKRPAVKVIETAIPHRFVGKTFTTPIQTTVTHIPGKEIATTKIMSTRILFLMKHNKIIPMDDVIMQKSIEKNKFYATF